MRKRRGARDGLFINGVHFPQEHFQRRGQIANGPHLNDDDVEDLEEAPENEIEQAEEEILDQATAASTMAELRAEIATLKCLIPVRFGTGAPFHQVESSTNADHDFRQESRAFLQSRIRFEPNTF
jgi:hypothetical protein